MIVHDDAGELLAAMALHAVEHDEAVEIEAHIAQCPRCQNELDGLRELASALGNSVEMLPEGLWSSIASRLAERTPRAAIAAPSLAPVGAVAATSVASVTSITAARAASPRRGRSLYVGFVAAAAASILALGIGLVNANNHVVFLQGALSAANVGVVQAALDTPGHKVVNLHNAQHQRIAQFVMLPDGRGYLVKSSLPVLSSKDTYQLWGTVNGSPVSLGVMGRSPHEVAFTMVSTTAPSALSVTVQTTGGSLLPSKDLAATGTV